MHRIEQNTLIKIDDKKWLKQASEHLFFGHSVFTHIYVLHTCSDSDSDGHLDLLCLVAELFYAHFVCSFGLYDPRAQGPMQKKKIQLLQA